MKRLLFVALLVASSVHAQVAVDKDKYRNSDHAPVQWKTSRSGSVDTLHVIVDSGGGGAVTIADGADATQGAKTDAKSTATDATSVSEMQVLKQISASVQSPPSQPVTNAGTFTTQAAEKQYAGVPSTFTVTTTDSTVFTLAAGERGFIQNLDDAAVAVKLGASASTISFSFILKAGAAADDGGGGAKEIKDWIGAVSIAAMAGSPRVIAWKQAP